MTYELCLEYGTYPLTPVDAFAEERTAIPEFIKDNAPLLEKMETMNALFHDLFLTIECQFHYIGSEYPEKRAQIKFLYEEISQELLSTYPEQDIQIDPFILH